MTRVKALPPDYQIVYQEMRRYLLKVGPSTCLTGSCCQGLSISRGGCGGKGVLELIGNDVAAFCDDLVKDSRTYANIHQESINGESAPPRRSTRRSAVLTAVLAGGRRCRPSGIKVGRPLTS